LSYIFIGYLYSSLFGFSFVGPKMVNIDFGTIIDQKPCEIMVKTDIGKVIISVTISELAI